MNNKKKLFIGLLSASFILASCNSGGGSAPAATSEESLTSEATSSSSSSASSSSEISHSSIFSSDISIESSEESESILTSETEIEESSEISEESSEESKTGETGSQISSETESSSESQAAKFAKLFNEIKEDVLTKHNYSLNIVSSLQGYEDDPYIDCIYNYNDKAYYGNYYSGLGGFILQKDQGYVEFVASKDGNIDTGAFYATNYNAGISSLYDKVAENFFISEYTQSSDNTFESFDEDIIALGSNFTGYISTSWFVGPEKILASVDEKNHALVFEVNFRVGFIDADTGKETLLPGKAILTLGHLGEVENAAIASYIENPTSTYVAASYWDEDTLEMFNSSFNGYIPPYIPHASYAISSYQSELYEHEIYVTDLACGDQRSNYAKLIEEEGFAEISEGTYTKVVEDNELHIRAIYTIEMAYKDPYTPDGRYTVGHYNPAGEFQVGYKVKTQTIGIETAEEFNKYLVDNDLDLYVPLLSFVSDVTKITKFEDRTAAMNALYGDYYLFFTSTVPTRLYIDSFETAKKDMEAYEASLKEMGFTHKESSPFTKTAQLEYPEASAYGPCYVMISDMSTYNASNYPGYVELRFNLFKFDEPKVRPSGYPTISVSNIDHLEKATFLNSQGKEITSFDKDEFGGYFYAKFLCEEGYKVSKIQVENDPNASANFDTELERWEIHIVKEDLTEIKLVLTYAEEKTHLLTIDSSLVGGRISLVSPSSEGKVEEETLVRFSVRLEEGYKLEKVFVVGHEDFEISKNIMGENSYYFYMPNFDVTISAVISREASESSSKEISSSEEPAISSSEEISSSSEIVSSSEEPILSRSEEPASKELSGTYSWFKGKLGGEDTYFRISFDKETLKGTYTRETEKEVKATINFSFKVKDDKFTLYYEEKGSDGLSNFATYRPFVDTNEEASNDTGIINDDGSISLTVYGYNGANPTIITFAK
ncbi:MAG: hypothetical protein SPL00_05220 [Bacilli bacterium]|nr:hypothetical protein [Bacilli bacterium]